jgi:hypothetical protein
MLVAPVRRATQLEPAEQQIEAVGRRRGLRAGVRVERSLGHRVASHEHEIRAVLDTSPHTEPAFVGLSITDGRCRRSRPRGPTSDALVYVVELIVGSPN